MTEQNNMSTQADSKPAESLTTRRALVAKNAKTAGALAAAALLAGVLTPRKANAIILPCFLRGTKILTASGERNVEDLAVGDLLPTAFGGDRPIQWIGRYRRTKSDAGKSWPKMAQPVRIAASALDVNVPHRDLYVTQGHCVLVDGVLVPAGSLVNGTTISLYDAAEHGELEFFHIKLESHDIITAEGAPCETLLTVTEHMSNFAEYIREHGEPSGDETRCAPVLCDGPVGEIASRLRSALSPVLGPHKIDEIRARLDERAVVLG